MSVSVTGMHLDIMSPTHSLAETNEPFNFSIHSLELQATLLE